LIEVLQSAWSSAETTTRASSADVIPQQHRKLWGSPLASGSLRGNLALLLRA
jgi:hypothetical protein